MSDDDQKFGLKIINEYSAKIKIYYRNQYLHIKDINGKYLKKNFILKFYFKISKFRDNYKYIILL